MGVREKKEGLVVEIMLAADIAIDAENMVQQSVSATISLQKSNAVANAGLGCIPIPPEFRGDAKGIDVTSTDPNPARAAGNRAIRRDCLAEAATETILAHRRPKRQNFVQQKSLKFQGYGL
jgi:hypothetical protein